MQPKIDFKKYNNGYDIMFYYERIISEYLTLSENANDGMSKYNIEAFKELKGVVEDELKPLLHKFAIFWVICNKVNNHTNYIQYRTVVESLKKQRNITALILKSLKKSKIDKDMYYILNKNTIKISERCKRLNNTIIPELVSGTELELYLSYLDKNNIELNDVISDIDSVDFADEKWRQFGDDVLDKVNEYFNSLSKEEQDAYISRKNKKAELQAKRVEQAKEQKHQESFEKLQSSTDSIKSNLDKEVRNAFLTLFKKDPNRSSRVRIIWEKIDNIEKTYRNYRDSLSCLDVCLVAHHPINSKGFFKSSIKIHKSKTQCVDISEIELATLYVKPFDNDKINAIKNNYKENTTYVTEVSLLDVNEYLQRRYEIITEEDYKKAIERKAFELRYAQNAKRRKSDAKKRKVEAEKRRLYKERELQQYVERRRIEEFGKKIKIAEKIKVLAEEHTNAESILIQDCTIALTYLLGVSKSFSAVRNCDFVKHDSIGINHLNTLTRNVNNYTSLVEDLFSYPSLEDYTNHYTLDSLNSKHDLLYGLYDNIMQDIDACTSFALSFINNPNFNCKDYINVIDFYKDISSLVEDFNYNNNLIKVYNFLKGGL